ELRGRRNSPSEKGEFRPARLPTSPCPASRLETLQVRQDGGKSSFDLAAEGDHRDNNHSGNRRDHNPVLDGGGTFLFLGEELFDGGGKFGHGWNSLSWVGRKTGTANHPNLVSDRHRFTVPREGPSPVLGAVPSATPVVVSGLHCQKPVPA